VCVSAYVCVNDFQTMHTCPSPKHVCVFTRRYGGMDALATGMSNMAVNDPSGNHMRMPSPSNGVAPGPHAGARR